MHFALKAQGKLLTVAALFTLLGGCTAVQVSPLHSINQHVCIEENPAVKVDDFIPVLQSGFARHGIQTKVHSTIQSGECSHIVTYTARRSWDMAPYLSSAEINVLDSQRRQLASGTYHLRGKGGLSLMKWQGTEAKIGPVIDEMLARTQVENLPMVQKASTAPSPAAAQSTAVQTLEQQLYQLSQENLDYPEYQRRYQQIMNNVGY
ncbi:Sbal_3080 family lipoprotein [Ectopseudomonas mendocina]|uniref:Sbal_3080 family lipoprotein n=1 Tax=Ectopseudomonas mendocina TaxID=300 RepID=A0ABZ2RE54_ECTME